jgi:hypothetical protein
MTGVLEQLKQLLDANAPAAGSSSTSELGLQLKALLQQLNTQQVVSQADARHQERQNQQQGQQVRTSVQQQQNGSKHPVRHILTAIFALSRQLYFDNV